MPARRGDGHPGEVPVRCLLVDDNEAFIETACRVLDQGDVMVTCTASSSSEALRQARELLPDVALIDVMLGDENGFDLARLLAGSGPAGSGPARTAVIMISSGAEDDYAELIADSPAAGFLPKTELSAAGILRILGG
jgi:DNA-binding NarL/FixJ family response regulator